MSYIIFTYLAIRLTLFTRDCANCNAKLKFSVCEVEKQWDCCYKAIIEINITIHIQTYHATVNKKI